MRACLEHQAEQLAVSVEPPSEGRDGPKVGKVGGCDPALGQPLLCSAISERGGISTEDFEIHHGRGGTAGQADAGDALSAQCGLTHSAPPPAAQRTC